MRLMRLMHLAMLGASTRGDGLPHTRCCAPSHAVCAHHAWQDADDSYTPLKQVSVPLTASWQMYEVDISVPKYRQGHTIIISYWVGEFAGSYALDDFQV